jgi:glucosamine--fructose-6-phosphate aminotransferase (isomerizing)
MCGIVGYVGERDAGAVLMDCLKRLEYRGYDSAGIGVVQDGRLEVRRSVGKIANLEGLLRHAPVSGRLGVAHTRWATHGKPSDENAHPHRDCSRSVAVVHNGIIENYRTLRERLAARGHQFGSETDSEVIAHMIEEAHSPDLESATQDAVPALKGAYALGIISPSAPGKLLAVRNGGPPLIIGLGEDGVFLASDVPAILGYTRDVLALDDGEMAVLSRDGVRIATLDGAPVHRQPTRIPWDAEAAEKGGFPHFMLKEIHEQPQAIEDTFRGRVDAEAGEVRLGELGLRPEELRRVDRVLIVACGTSWHAALVGKHMIESLARVPVEVDLASEFRYRPPIAGRRTLAIAISQSGETADTLGALREARAHASKALAVCNVVGSSISREADAVLYTRAGLEIGVASTKAFTTQLVALYLFAIHLARAKGAVSEQATKRLVRELLALPRMARAVLARADALMEVAQRFHGFSDFLYLGRGIAHPLALEGALKLKEISYIHAEGYAAGEMKHGPIALVDDRMPVVVLAPAGRLRDKTLANVEEVKARDGIVIALASEGDTEVAAKADRVIYLPRTSELLLPVLFALPLQLLAYHIAVLRHCDVDQPRNLAKSVTVE